jgi:hypothetical protein
MQKVRFISRSADRLLSTACRSWTVIAASSAYSVASQRSPMARIPLPS